MYFTYVFNAFFVISFIRCTHLLMKKKANRRRPAVVALTSSKLGEKYEELVGKKLELVECYKQEHLLRMESLKLDIELKKRMQNAAIKFNVDVLASTPQFPLI